MSNRRYAIVLLATIVGILSVPVAYGESAGGLQVISEAASKAFAASIAFGLAALGAGWAISRAGSAGLAATAERLEVRTTAIIITALGEALAIYGIVIAILILG